MKKASRTVCALMALVWRHYHGRPPVLPATETPRAMKVRHFRMLAIGLIIMDEIEKTAVTLLTDAKVKNPKEVFP